MKFLLGVAEKILGLMQNMSTKLGW